MKQQFKFPDFGKIELRVGTVLRVKENKNARKPAYVLTINFGDEIGIKKTSVQVTNYRLNALKQRKVIGVCNLPIKKVAGINSEVLILASIDCDETGHLLLPEKNCDPIA